MNTCPYCGGSTKRITCGGPACQMSLTDARRATAEYRKKMVAYRGTPKQMARQAEYHASLAAKAQRRARMVRACAEVASDAAKLGVIMATGMAVYIIAMPPTARAAAIAADPDPAPIMSFFAAMLLFLLICSCALLVQIAVLNAIDWRKFSAASRAALAKRRAEIKAENAEYVAAHRRVDGE